MAVAEIFLTAFITVLFEKLASADLIKLARSAGILSELEKWKSALFLIQAVLADAGHKHITKIAVQEWLNRLHHLAYDIDDLLDDLATEAMRRQMKKESYASTSTNKVFKIIPNLANFAPSNIMYGRKMSSKLDEITTRLHHLVEEKNLLGLNDIVESSNRTYGGTYRRSDETSLVGEVKAVGREADKEALLSELLGDTTCNQDVSIVSIVGMGGIGKTTLARALYNEKKVKDHFELMSWVCVSEKFDVFDISKAIFIDVGGDERETKSLNQLHEALQKKLSQKRFLIVLDDVWNENYREWELLQRPLLVGAPGSKIVVTTRKTKVTSVMDSVQAYPLKVLSKEAALSLFAQHALGEQNFDKHPTLKLLGEGIVSKSGRLPLALMTLGRVLRSKTNEEEWADLLNDEIWNLPNDQSDILPALKLSYYDLPSHLKQLFAYCCLFPKDYIFQNDKLVLLWMAEGFLHKSNPNKSMESFGREYFDELESRSFFQQCESGYTMHDLIHDLAISVGGEFFFTLGDKMGSEALEKVHHLSFTRKGLRVYKDFKALQRARRLRTLLSVSMSPREQDYIFAMKEFFLPNEVLSELLPELQFLRVLSLTDYSIEEVPRSIGCFKHMRYLNFSRTNITCLPDQITGLYNLQSLLVSGCRRLSSLPNSFAKLINLRHLDISDTPQLSKTPIWIDGLKTLQTLSKVIIGGANVFKISELTGVLHLEGQLLIEGLEKVVNPIQAKDANLQQRKDLDNLELKWSDVFEDSRDKKIEYEVLEGLRPHHKLIKLNISFYGGIGFPSWIGESSFAHLTELTLRGCRSCTRLPTLGHLRSLKKLFVSSMNEVKTLGIELLTTSNSLHGIAFPSLVVLKFEDMQSWEKWSTSNGDNNGTTIESFPCLCEISIVNCPKLVDVSAVSIPSLRVLCIEECSEEVVRSMVCVSSSIRELRLQSIKGLTQLHGEVLKHLGAVEYLYIKECDELRYLWEIESEFLVSLRKLEVRECKELVSLGEKVEVDSQNSMELVRDVVIYDCKSLGSCKCPNNVERLRIEECPSITSLTFQSSTLKSLDIVGCEKVEESWHLNNILSSLESLTISGNLRLFPEGCFVHLTRLEIWRCDNIESIPEKGFGSLPLRRLLIFDCKNLKSFPHEQLQSLTSLEDLEIRNCPNMDNSFPSGLWPPNLRRLEIGCLKNPIAKEEEDGTSSSSSSAAAFILPPSLLYLELYNFEKVESVSEGLQHLTRLEQLSIWNCKKVRDLPETLLPSLSSLTVRYCSNQLKKKCGRGKGNNGPASKVIIEGSNGFKISDLKGLLHLRGQLLIEGLEKVVNPIGAKDANLQQRKDLYDLEFKWSLNEDSRNKKIEYEEKWSTSGGDNNGTIEPFPRLCEISILNCPKLVDLSGVSIRSLRVLHIERCSEEVVRSMVCVSSSIKELKLQKIRGLGQLCGEVLKHLGAVEDLFIIKCDELRYLLESELEFLANLRTLEVFTCKELVSLGEKVEVDSPNSMELVREVKIYDCESLGSYRCPNNVERLRVEKCPSIKSLTFLSTLKFLCIVGCEKLEESWLLNNILSSLESLTIWKYGCFVHLTQLAIWSCDNLESIPAKGFGSLALRRLMIIECKNLKSFPHEKLQSLTSLEDLVIRNCPNMDNSFPSGWWPPNLRSLSIGCLNKAMSEWGLQNYPTSLVELDLGGQDSGVVSFAEAKEEEDGT
ncbi:hypothetical protein OSB04_013121 [Centaurea solstitialis]|uniref:Uncharacterized protein n=1 Tax=Centaurea solstitialis TaxID=347529 RepID=A0AA38TVP3_9ASTR|nr:hypothetical protein OSB04_013121 [Centaurea solstitialis]